MITNERGFTLVEILVSLAIFAVVIVGALGVLGAAGAGGFLEGFPTGFVTARAARDTTAAAVYVQAFQERAASQVSSTLVPGTYCDGLDCTVTTPIVSTPISPASGLTGYSTPPGQPYQLDWRRLDVTIERWYWDDTIDTDGAGPDKSKVYCRGAPTVEPGCTMATPATEFLVRIRSKLTWQFRGVSRTMEVDRFLP